MKNTKTVSRREFLRRASLAAAGVAAASYVRPSLPGLSSVVRAASGPLVA